MIDIDKLKLRDWIKTPHGTGVVQGFVVVHGARQKVIVSLGSMQKHTKTSGMIRTGRSRNIWNLVMFTPDVLKPARD